MADKVQYMTPPGTLVVEHVWAKHTYKDPRGKEGKPQYQAVVAFDRDGDKSDLDDLFDIIYDMAVAEWGEGAAKDIDNGVIKIPIRDGDAVAKDREQKGKSGDATRGKDVLQAATIYNLDGDDADGGIWVVDAEGNQVEWDRKRMIYPGAKVRLSITLDTYKVDNRGVCAYLNGLQFVEDGERIGGGDRQSMFSAVVTPESEGKGRRGRGK